jgi:mono/diheme cytochrome c family protein
MSQEVTMRRALLLFVAVFACAAGPMGCTVAPASGSSATLERGRYMVLTGHCNNCHTAGYVATSGKIPEGRWLMGNPVGWRSKQGTTYGTNLRLYVQNLSEEGWIQAVRNGQPRAPMPWWSLRETSEDDLRAMYRYIRSLAPLGEPAPAFLPPDQMPPRPYQQLPDMS